MSSPSDDPFARALDERAPQMRDYEALEPVLHPYLGFTSPANFRSPAVTTDSLGFRRSEHGGEVVSTETIGDGGGFGVALGASFMFGVGSTHDRHSVVSRLGEELGRPFLNRAVRAGNSMQELLAALPVLDRADAVVLGTGANNLGLAFSSSRTYDGLGPLFYDEWTALLAGRRLDELTAAAAGTSLRGTLKAVAARARPRPASQPGPRREPEAVIAEAAGRHLRDLGLVVAAARAATALIFVVQPYADPRLREPHADERDLIRPLDGAAAGWWGATLDFLAEHWGAYTERLRAGCAELGVRFAALEASAFEGWAYVDRVHMTDNGQRQAAAMIKETLS
jgi:hypothetical protein